MGTAAAAPRAASLPAPRQRRAAAQQQGRHPAPSTQRIPLTRYLSSAMRSPRQAKCSQLPQTWELLEWRQQGRGRWKAVVPGWRQASLACIQRALPTAAKAEQAATVIAQARCHSLSLQPTCWPQGSQVPPTLLSAGVGHVQEASALVQLTWPGRASMASRKAVISSSWSGLVKAAAGAAASSRQRAAAAATAAAVRVGAMVRGVRSCWAGGKGLRGCCGREQARA